jgi:hypothetical protein
MAGRGLLAVVATTGLLTAALLPAVVAGPSEAAPVGASAFVPLSPARILDTRTGLGGTTVGDGGTITVQVGGVGGVPVSGAVAVALNLTATNATQAGFVTAWPTGAGQPVVSNLNVERAGQTVPNFAVVRLGSGGRVSFYALKQLDLLADVAGYWVEATTATAGRYVAAGPARILDTRTGVGAPAGKLADGGTLTLQVAGRAGVPASGVSAVILNLTATESTQPGFVTAWPAGGGQPLASNLNVERVGQTIPNLAMVPVGAGGAVSLFALRSLHLIADVLGYFTNATAPASDQGLFVPLNPARILDTRAVPQRGGLYTHEVVGTYRADLVVAGRGGVPASGVGAVIANVTATNATQPGFVTVYPAATNQPLASNLNVESQGQTIANLAVARLGYLGRVSLYSLTDIDLLFDVAGWFTGDLTSPDPGVPTSPPVPPPPSTTTTTTTPPVQSPTPTTTTSTTAPRAGPPPNPGNAVDCGNFTTWQQAYDWYITYYPYYGDVAHLDADNDGVPCESLPGAP